MRQIVVCPEVPQTEAKHMKLWLPTILVIECEGFPDSFWMVKYELFVLNISGTEELRVFAISKSVALSLQLLSLLFEPLLSVSRLAEQPYKEIDTKIPFNQTV